jgi:hypothetical protein
MELQFRERRKRSHRNPKTLHQFPPSFLSSKIYLIQFKKYDGRKGAI